MESDRTTQASLNQEGKDGRRTSEQQKVVEIDGTTATATPPKTTVKHDDYDGYIAPNDDREDDDDEYDDRYDSDAECHSDPERYLRKAINDDDVPEFFAQMKLLFYLDDFDGNLELGETAEPNTRELLFCPERITKEICISGAVACATALLEGQTSLSMDLNFPLFDGDYPLHIAAFLLQYDLVKLFLSHGARTDVTNIYLTRRSLLHKRSTERIPLPLNNALDMLDDHMYLVGWTPEESIYKLLIILCLPQMKVALETIKLLALSTENANDVFIDYAKEGKLIQMAVLLLVANEHVMAPSTFQGNDGGVVEGGMSIRDKIMHDFLSQGDEEGGVSVYNGEKRRRLIFTLMLLKLFEIAGGAITSYLQSQQSHVPKERVVKDVASILKEAGFVLKEKDIDLSNID